MRYVLAIAALAISAVLLVFGVGQRTFLAADPDISYTVESAPETEYAVIPGEILDSVAGQANIVVDGANPFVAVGATRDVEAWTAPYAHSEFTADAANKELLGAVIAPEVAPEDPEADAEEAAEPPEPLDPRGSDLWLDERSLSESTGDDEQETTASGTLRMPVALEAGQSVLIAADGTEPAPQDISIVWVQDRDTPWAGPLLAGSALFALIGAVLYLLAIDHNRRGLGPQRGRRGPLLGIRNSFGKKRRAEQNTSKTVERRALRVGALPVLGLAAALTLSGCSASYWPDFSEQPVEEVPEEEAVEEAPLPVTEPQFEMILSRVASVAGESDETLDAELLATRFTGDALDERSANYKIREADPDYEVVPPSITDETLGYSLVQSTTGWPRTLFATVASTMGGAEEDAPAAEAEAEGDASAEEDAVPEEEAASSPSLAIVLTQQNPHENFLVSHVVSLRGGISMPEAAPAEEGTALLSDDLQSLTLPPGEVAPAYASVLEGGIDVEEAESFMLEGDPLVERSGAAWAAEANSEAEADDSTVKYSVDVSAGDSKVVSLSTGVGGALVATTIMEDRIEDSEGEPLKPTASPSIEALSGLEGRQEMLVREVSHQMLFYVPSETSGAPIQILGATTGMVGARSE